MSGVITYTIAELDDAIRYVSGADRDLAVRSEVRVLAHHRACFEAFVRELSGPKVDILRQAARDLSRSGAYQPRDGVWPCE